MTQINPKTLLLRANCAFDLRYQWRNVLTDAYELGLPARNPYDESKNPRSLSRLFDSTAPNSIIRGANRLLMELTPPDQYWGDVVAGPFLEMQLDEKQIADLKKKLAPIAKMVGLTFMSGMFINAVWEMYIDLLISGLGALLTLENPSDFGEPCVIQCVSQAEIAIEENGRGEIGGVYRKRKMKARQIADVWDDAEIPQELQDMIDGKGVHKKNQDPEIELLEVTYEGGPKSNVPWYYEVLWCKQGEPQRIVERNYDTSPWNIFRWSKLPGIPYGPGPVLMALADIRTVNAIVAMLLKNASLALSGIYLAKDDGVLNPDNVLLSPGAILPVASTGGTLGASLVPLETGRNFNVSQLVLETLQANIKKALFDNALPPAESTVRSPTEIMQRVKELTQDIGGNIGRLTTDLSGLYRRVTDIHVRKGLVPAIKIDQLTLKVQINSPLARSQQMNEVQTVINWLQMVQALGGPQAIMISAVIEKIPAWVGGKLGVPAELIRTKDESDQVQKDIAKVSAAGADAGQAGAGGSGQAGAAPALQAA